MIEFEGVSKSYRTGLGRKMVISDATALFEPGRSYGVLGVRGSGKSTLLRLIAGTDLPDAGRIRRKVRVSWPLGFNGTVQRKLTGRENIRFLARIYGEDPKRVISFVEDFSEVGADIDMPVSSYPPALRARLVFGVSMAINFDRYLVDGLSVLGDPHFRARCLEVFQDRRKHADVIMVSHKPDTLKSYCDAGVILAGGKLRFFGDLNEALNQFQGSLAPGARAAAWSDEEDEE